MATLQKQTRLELSVGVDEIVEVEISWIDFVVGNFYVVGIGRSRFR